MLLECEGDALDLSGDMGAVGRFSVCQGQAKDDEELLLDLKGKNGMQPLISCFLNAQLLSNLEIGRYIALMRVFLNLIAG